MAFLIRANDGAADYYLFFDKHPAGEECPGDIVSDVVYDQSLVAKRWQDGYFRTGPLYLGRSQVNNLQYKVFRLPAERKDQGYAPVAAQPLSFAAYQDLLHDHNELARRLGLPGAY